MELIIWKALFGTDLDSVIAHFGERFKQEGLF